jgi:hypothetical protein
MAITDSYCVVYRHIIIRYYVVDGRIVAAHVMRRENGHH